MTKSTDSQEPSEGSTPDDGQQARQTSGRPSPAPRQRTAQEGGSAERGTTAPAGASPATAEAATPAADQSAPADSVEKAGAESGSAESGSGGSGSTGLADAATVQAEPVAAGDPAEVNGSSSAEPSAAPSAAQPAERPAAAERGEREQKAAVNGYEGQPATLPPPWKRVPASASTGGHESVGVAAARSSAAAAAGSVATEAAGGRPSGVPRETKNDLSSARTVHMDPPTTQMRLPLTGPDPDEVENGGSSGVKGWPPNRRPRQAALQLKRLDPWSVLKISLVLAVVLYLVWLVAVGVLYGVLDGIGVWDRLNGQYADLVAEQSGDRLISAGRVLGVAAVIGAVNSLLVAVAMSVGAFVYNVAADLVGGVEVTLSERD